MTVNSLATLPLGCGERRAEKVLILEKPYRLFVCAYRYKPYSFVPRNSLNQPFGLATFKPFAFSVCFFLGLANGFKRFIYRTIKIF